jgi:LmbE family N-acetylglucosaminyl deacetylase
MSILHDDVFLPNEPTDDGMLSFIRQFQDAPVPAGLPRRAVDKSLPHIAALQPHPDDVALSIGGLLVQLANPLTVLTVYSDSLDPTTTAQRRKEDSDYVAALGASHRALGYRERQSASTPRPADVSADVAELVRDHLAERSSLAFAPAAVSRYVDHVAVHQTGRQLGCAVYWEDVAFWSIYAASIEDRILFSERNHAWLEGQVLVAVDISSSAKTKASLLRCYASQSEDRWRPLRYAWSAAREVGRSGYCERIFVAAEQLEACDTLFGGTISRGPTICYGTSTVPTVWATIGAGER